jgi:hypothetical protein
MLMKGARVANEKEVRVMKAITVKYVGPSNVKGARLIATDGDTRMIFPYDHSSSNPYRDAAIAFCKRMKWTGAYAQGSTKNTDVFVPLDDDKTFEVTE